MGQRNHMEDTYCCIQDLGICPGVKVSYFAVFDGHGGGWCAKFLKENLHKQLAQSLTKIDSAGILADFAQSKLA